MIREENMIYFNGLKLKLLLSFLLLIVIVFCIYFSSPFPPRLFCGYHYHHPPLYIIIILLTLFFSSFYYLFLYFNKHYDFYGSGVNWFFFIAGVLHVGVLCFRFCFRCLFFLHHHHHHHCHCHQYLINVVCFISFYLFLFIDMCLIMR